MLTIKRFNAKVMPETPDMRTSITPFDPWYKRALYMLVKLNYNPSLNSKLIKL